MKINIYRCDVCGAYSYEKQGNTIQYVGYGRRKVFEHVCDDCMCEFLSFLSKMENSEEEKIVFVDAEDGHLKFCNKGSPKMDEVAE